MQNVKVIDKNGRLIIEIDKNADRTDSSSGKSEIVASTKGNQIFGATKDGRPIKLGINCYVEKV